MQLRLTPALEELLRGAANDASAPQELRTAAQEGAAAASSGGTGTVDWATVKGVVQHARQQQGDGAIPSMQQLCRGSGIAFPKPPKPQGKPPELQRRLEELKARLEQQQYDRMVEDVTQEERKARALREGGLVTYKQQMSFAVHVLAMMGAFYAFGHLAGMAITSNRAVHPFVGLAFMVSALLLETVLFIIRTTLPPKMHQAAARRAQEARLARQNQRQQQQQQLEANALAGAGAEAPAGGSAGGAAGSDGGQVESSEAEPAGGRKPAAEKKAD